MDKRYIYAENRFRYAVRKREVIYAIRPDSSKKKNVYLRKSTLENRSASWGNPMRYTVHRTLLTVRGRGGIAGGFWI